MALTHQYVCLSPSQVFITLAMLRCPICQLKYTTVGESQPRLLITCGHTFCNKCLETRKGATGDRIECPQCSLVCEEPHVPNITIMNYVDAQSQGARTQAVHQLPPSQSSTCQDCQEATASVVCFQCLPAGFKFCDACSDREHNRPFGPVREHSPKAIASVRFQSPVPNCQRHPGNPCLFFSFKANKVWACCSLVCESKLGCVVCSRWYYYSLLIVGGLNYLLEFTNRVSLNYLYVHLPFVQYM